MIKKLSNYEKIYICILFFLIILSFFIVIPSDVSNIGISSSLLDLGDRGFYINDFMDRGYGDADSGGYYGNILYPLILKLITFLSNLFGKDESSKLWNLITISLSSTLSITTLILLRKSTFFIFKRKISEIVCLIYVLNPYSYYYPISGGITNYVLFGVTFLLYVFCRSFKNGSSITKNNRINDLILINIGCIYLSFLRPTGAIMGFIILIFFLYKNLGNFLRNEKLFTKNLIIFFIISIGILLVTYNIVSTLDYTKENLSIFTNDEGLFFGYPRDVLKNKLNFSSGNFILNIKNIFYFLIWKITEFLSGISDIRDTYSATDIDKVLPFLIRTFTGIFFLFPINLFSSIGLFLNRKLILKSDIWILILACIVSILPSFLGFSISRYLIMCYSPLILFAAKSIGNTFNVIDNE